VGHRFPTFLEKASSADTCVGPHPSPFFPNLSGAPRCGEARVAARCECRGVAHNSFRPADECRASIHGRARASSGNRFMRISIIVIKHAASMNYLFVGGRRSAREEDGEEQETRKGRGEEETRPGEHYDGWLAAFGPFPAGCWVQSANETEERRNERGRQRVDARVLSLSRFVEAARSTYHRHLHIVCRLFR